MSKEKLVKITINSLLLQTQEYEEAVAVLDSRIASGKCISLDKALLQILKEHKEKYLKILEENNKNLPVYRGRDLPKPGDIIYVRTSWSIDHGENDVQGGKAKVKSVLPLKNHNLGWVNVWEHPDRSYGWAALLADQDKLEKEFGDSWAYPDPDYDDYKIPR